MKILHIIRAHPLEHFFGLDRSAWKLACHISKMGNEVHMVYGFVEKPKHVIMEEYVDGVYLHPLMHLPQPPLVRGFAYNFGLLTHLVKLHRSYGFDIIHFHGALTALGPPTLRALKIIDVPFIMHLHGATIAEYRVAMSRHKTPLSFANFCLSIVCDALGAHIADRVIAISYDTAKTAIKCYRIHPSKVSVVYHGVDLKKNMVLSKRNIGKSVLFVGQDLYKKGAKDLIVAFRLVVNKLPDAKLFIVGGIDERHIMLAKDLGLLNKTIFFLSSISDVELNKLYETCRIFALPSYYEGFGLVFLEAMAYGKPIVSYETSAIPEIVQDGETGILIEPGNTGQLAKVLIKLLTDDSLYHEMSKKAFERAKLFTWLEAARKIVRIYEETLARREGRR